MTKSIGIFFIASLIVGQSFAESVSIPLKTVKKPAADLLASDGTPLDVGQAASLAQKGTDLSLLNPAENRLWQNQKNTAQNLGENTFPSAETGVKWFSDEAQLPFTYMGRVQSRENPNLYYRFSLSRFSHTTLMRAALLRKLGYFVPTPKYYRRLRVTFANETEKNDFMIRVQDAMTSDFESRGWILENDKTGHSLVFSDALLEVQTADYFDIQWGYAPDPSEPSQLAVVQSFSRNRAYRALIIPYGLVDVPESVNRFSPKFGAVLSGHVVLTHPSAESFSAVTFEDARWLVRRLAALSEADLREIVREGYFPPQLEPLITAKLLYRVNNAFELFAVKPATVLRLPSLDITTADGLIQNGKVMKEFVPGYPQRFSHGDRESPFKDGDFQRYLGTRAKSSLITTVLGQINERLQLLKVSDLASQRRETIKQRVIEHIKTKPWEPLYQQVEAWGGPVAGFNVNAARHITTGTYYGSNAAIQMVDNLSVQGSLGWFLAVDGVPNITPMGGANVMILRDYTHVRPVLSIEEGSKAKWDSLMVPNFMTKLSKVLTSDALIAGQNADDPKRHPLDAFLSELRDGEVFTITDSVALSLYAQVATSFDVLMGITPLSFLNSVSLSGDASRVILRQTSIMRTGQGVQVMVRSQKGSMFGLTMDVNYFVNLVKIRAQTQKNELKTDAFVIDYDPGKSEMVETDSQVPSVQKFLETRRNLRMTLLALFKDNDTELLYSKFKYQKFEIDHLLKTKELRSRVLVWKMANFTEDHELKIRYPRSPEAPNLDPKNEEITLFAHKKGELKGRDFLSMLTDLFAALLNRTTKAQIMLDSIDDPNPANTPYGSAEWRIVTTEGDLTKNPAGGKRYPDIAVVQHVWGGWKLKQKEFFKLIDEIQSQFAGTKVASYRLIEKEAFSTVKSVDFYRITANLSVLPGGISRLRDLLLQPEFDGRPAPVAPLLLRMAQSLSEKIGGYKARANDKEAYRDLLTIIGNGSYDKGLGKCNMAYEEAHNNREHGNNGNPGAWINGTYYDCMMPWLDKLLVLARQYPKNDAKARVRWTTNVLWVLEEQIPLPQLLKFLKEENYVFVVRVNGFRTGDEDGDLEFFSNTLGDPKQNLDYASGLISMFATKTRISPIELDRSLGSFR